MKYLVALLVLIVACAATTSPQQDEIDYIGRYIGVSVNDISLEMEGVEAEFTFREDFTCSSRLIRLGGVPWLDECTYTEPDKYGNTFISYVGGVPIRGTFQKGGDEFVLLARPYRWVFVKFSGN